MNPHELPTPRTKAKIIRVCQNWGNQGDHVREVVFAEDSAQLEREAAAWKAVAEMYRGHRHTNAKCAEAFDALTQQLKTP